MYSDSAWTVRAEQSMQLDCDSARRQSASLLKVNVMNKVTQLKCAEAGSLPPLYAIRVITAG
jgi:hypothetical protein